MKKTRVSALSTTSKNSLLKKRTDNVFHLLGESANLHNQNPHAGKITFTHSKEFK